MSGRRGGSVWLANYLVRPLATVVKKALKALANSNKSDNPASPTITLTVVILGRQLFISNFSVLIVRF